MDKPSYYADTIKAQVDLTEALEYYGVTFNRAGFASCPFHSERTASFKVKGDRAHCFGCGWSGDLISFVMDMFHVDFNGAVCKINADFNCGLILDRRPTIREQREIEQRQAAINAKREAFKTAHKLWQIRYDAACDLQKYCDDLKMQYAPNPGDEQLHPLYCCALDTIDYLDEQVFLISMEEPINGDANKTMIERWIE